MRRFGIDFWISVVAMLSGMLALSVYLVENEYAAVQRKDPDWLVAVTIVVIVELVSAIVFAGVRELNKIGDRNRIRPGLTASQLASIDEGVEVGMSSDDESV